MNSLFNSVLETASLFKNCDGYSQSTILKEELSHVLISCFAFIICANIKEEDLIAEVNKKYNKYHFLKSEVKTHERKN